MILYKKVLQLPENSTIKWHTYNRFNPRYTKSNKTFILIGSTEIATNHDKLTSTC